MGKKASTLRFIACGFLFLSSYMPSSARYLCRTTVKGIEYSGVLSTSAAGRTCLHWDDQLVESELTQAESPFRLPEGNYTRAENYCRNPSNDDQGPWCFTSDQCGSVVKQHCNVPFCAPHQDHCKTSSYGYSYTRDLNYTRTGRVCQRWDSQVPQPHTKNNPANFPEVFLADAGNFCRNPDGESGGPWCYTIDPAARYQFCDIPMCNGGLDIASMTPIAHTMTTSSFTDDDQESCQQVLSPSANDLRFSIVTSATWIQLNVELTFISSGVRSCRDSLFMAFHTASPGSCGPLTMCQWVDVVAETDKSFCRFTCSCTGSCQSVTLAIPSQLPDFKLCEVAAWSW